uniref:Protein kinase domain-containing protein n=1 Tax=Eptatretus burgeri TaxID=7764 RepID=A0A8C4WW64_EPTBU
MIFLMFIILFSLHYPHIVQALGITLSTDQCFMVTEFFEADTLSGMLCTQGKFSEELVKPIILQAASAFGYMHNLNMTHGDIKLGNLLYSKAGVLKVIDFGLAKKFRPGTLMRYRGGTKPFMSPEILQKKNYDGPAADVWALGVVLHTLLRKKHPFKKKALQVSNKIDGFIMIIIILI